MRDRECRPGGPPRSAPADPVNSDSPATPVRMAATRGCNVIITHVTKTCRRGDPSCPATCTDACFYQCSLKHSQYYGNSSTRTLQGDHPTCSRTSRPASCRPRHEPPSARGPALPGARGRRQARVGREVGDGGAPEQAQARGRARPRAPSITAVAPRDWIARSLQPRARSRRAPLRGHAVPRVCNKARPLQHLPLSVTGAKGP